MVCVCSFITRGPEALKYEASISNFKALLSYRANKKNKLNKFKIKQNRTSSAAAMNSCNPSTLVAKGSLREFKASLLCGELEASLGYVALFFKH